MATAVADASALVALARLDLLDLLSDLFDEVLVPEGVRDEAILGRADAPDARTIEHALSAGRLRLRPAAAESTGEAWQRSLGRGEAEVIQLARDSHADFVVLDDLAARRIADGLGLLVIGTVGVLLLARRAGRIAAVLPLVERLRATGFRLSDDVVDAIREEEQT